MMHSIRQRVWLLPLLVAIALACATPSRRSYRGPGALPRAPAGFSFVSGPYPVVVSGTRTPNSDTTEPLPAKSRFFRVEHGGVVVVPQGAGLYLQVAVLETPPTPYHIVIEYENPQSPGSVLTNDQIFHPDADAFRFSSPEVMRGLSSYETYKVRVLVYETRDSTTPIDVLVQEVRSYVDTTRERVLLNRVVRPR